MSAHWESIFIYISCLRIEIASIFDPCIIQELFSTHQQNSYNIAALSHHI